MAEQPVPFPSTIAEELRRAGDRLGINSQADKKNYAQRLSDLLAVRFADALRSEFEGILPDEAGRGLESRARTAKGVKKLDVNYSNPQIGLGLGISIKTLNFRDPKSKRYTKNFTRIDNELRAEAHDYHERQPFAVMVGLIFLPADACDDGSAKDPSSFGGAVRLFRLRAGRSKPTDPAFLFERLFIALYEPGGEIVGSVAFFDVAHAPPRTGRPASEKVLSIDGVLREIKLSYDLRNNPPFEWDES